MLHSLECTFCATTLRMGLLIDGSTSSQRVKVHRSDGLKTLGMPGNFRLHFQASEMDSLETSRFSPKCVTSCSCFHLNLKMTAHTMQTQGAVGTSSLYPNLMRSIGLLQSEHFENDLKKFDVSNLKVTLFDSLTNLLCTLQLLTVPPRSQGPRSMEW